MPRDTPPPLMTKVMKNFPFFSTLILSSFQLNAVLILKSLKSIIFLDPSARDLSTHPPHLLDSQGNLTPAAFIPFCAYQGNLTTAGRYLPGLELNYPVCDRFFKTIYEGEVCYAIDMANVLKNSNTLPGKGNGLILALDMGMNIGQIGGEKKEKKVSR